MTVVPCFAQKVNVDFAEDADFSKFRTYQYQNGTLVPSQLMDQRVIAAIDYHLAMKSYEQVHANPDLAVTYHAAARRGQTITTDHFGTGYGRYWGSGIGTSTSRVHNYTKGALVVDIWDAKEKSLLWRGTATDTVSDKPEKNEKKINKSFEKMFKKFPPEQK
jgi:hypothetical protein